MSAIVKPPSFKKTYYKKATAYKSKPKPISVNKIATARFLVIVESPSKCTKIENYLGPEYQCIASKGHIRELNGLKSINTKGNFEPTFQICEDKKQHVEFMRAIIDQYPKQNVILASDDDREGEAIAAHICEVFDLPIDTTPRIIFHEITKPALLAAIQTPSKINQNLVKAQHARQILDVIVGFKISPLLWKYIYHAKSNSLSAGRCQTPALRLIYDNEMDKTDILEYKYKTVATFFNQNLKFELNQEFTEKEDVRKFLVESQTFQHKLILDNKKLSNKSPPKPFHTSNLLQTASNTLHYSPKQTMQLAQQLYQDGYITYMRTENNKYSADFLKVAAAYIVAEFGERHLGKIEELENQDKINPHEAIRVTKIEMSTLNADADSKAASLYKLIWRNTVESCMSEAQYNTYKASILAPFKWRYEYVLEIPLFLGWKTVSEKMSSTELQNIGSGILMHLQAATSAPSIPYNSVESTVVVHKKHHHYTEASLIHKLEELGIGRPSTFALLVETIQDRGYVLRTDLSGNAMKCVEFKLTTILEEIENERVFGQEKNKLVIQPTGILCIEFLISHFSKIFSYDYTKHMEEELDKISNQSVTESEQKSWYEICKQCYNEIKELTKPIANISKRSYTIDETHEFIFHPHGASIVRTLENGDIEYLPVKKNIKIDLDALKTGKYTLEELVEFKQSFLGKYEDHPLHLRIGQYGPYAEWGENRKNIGDIGIPLNEITLENMVTYLDSITELSNDGADSQVDKTIVRVLDEEFSIRKGKFGSYVYYKKATSKKPQFLNIRKFKDNYLECESTVLLDWLKTTYSL